MKQAMRLWLPLFLVLLGLALPAHSAKWVTLKHLAGTRLSLDKQSIAQEPPYQKAWIKAEYQTPQKNIESVDRTYNQAKALWYFDCAKQKAATIQVFQYLDQELVYSAGIDPKNADFVDPLPESEVDLAKQYVCDQQVAKEKREQAKKEQEKLAQANAAKTPPAITKTDSANADPSDNTKVAADKPVDEKKQAEKKDGVKKEDAKKGDAKKGEESKDPKSKGKQSDKHTEASKSNAKVWSYQAESGPANWATLDPQYALCGAGKNQSPIHLQNTIPAALKPLKMLQKFPAKQVTFQQHAINVVMGEGNMMVLDQQPYQLKNIILHSPAEHQIKQKNYVAEVQLVHQNKQGDTVVLAVMVEEGEVHAGLEKVLQLPIKPEMTPMPLKLRLTPAEFMPGKSAYMRYSGSLTTPPCTEGVQWVVMKAPITASKQQLTQLGTLLGGANQRPTQPTAGRMILE